MIAEQRNDEFRGIHRQRSTARVAVYDCLEPLVAG